MGTSVPQQQDEEKADGDIRCTHKMDFIIIANAWSAGKDNPTSKHRIALELVRRGHRVLWVEGSGMRAPSVGSSGDRLKMAGKIVAALRGARRVVTPQGAGLRVLSPLFVPMPRYETVRRLNGLICRASMAFWSRWLGFRDPVLINYVPVLAEAMRGRRPTKGSEVCGLKSVVSPRAPRAVYHCVDRWDQFAMYDSAMMAEMDRRCCVYADLVVASSGELYERCKVLNPRTVLIPHGVDWEHFRRATDGEGDATREGRREAVIGFFGLLSEWIDQDLLLKLARDIPEARLVLIGKADVPVTRLEGVPNIQLTGSKPFAELPAHIARFTVGIIPFVVNDLTRAVNPIKLREMLAAGCPVVSTALPEVERYAGTGRAGFRAPVQIARDHGEFVAMVKRVIDHPSRLEERRALSDWMASETWSAKVEEMLRLVARGCEATEAKGYTEDSA